MPHDELAKTIDAAFETVVKTIAHWEAQIAAHPDTFCAIRRGADLEAARSSRKVGAACQRGNRGERSLLEEAGSARPT